MPSYIFRFRKIKLLLLSLLLFIEGNAQGNLDPGGPEELSNKLNSLDSILFDAFSNCTISRFRSFFNTTDFEFYEEKGVTTSIDDAMKTVENGCGQGWGVKREVTKSSLQSCPIAEFGGILTGEQSFYIVKNGAKEVVQSSKFVEVWKQEGNDWKITKLIFYDQEYATKGIKIPSLNSKTLAERDSSLFSVVYSCKPEQVKTFLTEDLEFYHDKGGVTKTLTVFLEQLNNNFCGEGKVKLRRELVKGSLKTYDFKDGAIQEGEHKFYITEGGKEMLSGIARFIHIWRKQDGVWKISKVLSLDHKPAN
jgi:hypothetical protein